MDNIQLLTGHVLDVLKALPDESVHCVITSPPYWGLRAYGTEPQIWLNGKEPCAEHTWGEQIPPRGTSRWSHFQKEDGTTVKSDYTKTISTGHGNTCSICGAWRGELGLEPTVQMYVDHLIQIFREVKRVLRRDGVCFVNLGDSYAGAKGQSGTRGSEHQEGRFDNGESLNRGYQTLGGAKQTKPTDDIAALREMGLGAKQLIGVPWRFAFAMQADGWILRQDIIWAKPNPMPESVRDRCTKAHEYIFLFAKSPRYFYDYQAILEPANYDGRKRTRFDGSDKYQNGFAPVDTKPQTMALRGHERWSRKMQGTGYGGDGKGLHGHSGYYDADGKLRCHLMPPIGGVKKAGGDNPTYSGERREQVRDEEGVPARNKRDVWWVSTKPYSGAHFATFAPDLIEPMILAGTSARGVCPKCGAQWERVTKVKERIKQQWSKRTNNPQAFRDKREMPQKEILTPVTETTGWRPTCDCNAGEPIPATVLDPFSGAGTTGLVAVKHRRNYIGIDLKGEYNTMARERIAKAQIAMELA